MLRAVVGMKHSSRRILLALYICSGLYGSKLTHQGRQLGCYLAADIGGPEGV